MKRLFASVWSLSLIGILPVAMSCNTSTPASDKAKTVRLVTLDPGHFHAALVQKIMYADVDSVVHVYAPEGADVALHLNRINSYNSREKDPTHWNEQVYAGSDFFEKMIANKTGNVVVLAGNNHKKTEYILKSLQAGFNVLADKPMVIDNNNFELLKQAFATAAKDSLLLYDIMTERYEITSILQRELAMLPAVFGTLEKGTVENPAVIKQSVHQFYKNVSGSVLTRPAWFFDASQQGDGLTDVMTHLVDLVQWECFPNQSLDYTKDITVNTSSHYQTTDMSSTEFRTITKLDSFPGYLKKDVVNDTVLQVHCNGEINYQVRGVHIKTSVAWAYKSPGGTEDTYYAMMRGSKANLVIRQGMEEQFMPTLYIELVGDTTGYEKTLVLAIKSLQEKYPGLELKKENKRWQIIIPAKYKEGHESHFARVTQKFLEYLNNHNMPVWEVPNMLAKYYTTTKALEIAKRER